MIKMKFFISRDFKPANTKDKDNNYDDDDDEEDKDKDDFFLYFWVIFIRFLTI